MVFGGSGNSIGPVRWLRGKNEAEDKGPRLKGARPGEEEESEAPRAAPKVCQTGPCSNPSPHPSPQPLTPIPNS